MAGYINLLDESGLLCGLQTKSNAEKRTASLDRFRETFNPQSAFIVGDGGIPAEDFLTMDVRQLFNRT